MPHLLLNWTYFQKWIMSLYSKEKYNSLHINSNSSEKWEEHWKQKMKANGYFEIQINSVECVPCEHF